MVGTGGRRAVADCPSVDRRRHDRAGRAAPVRGRRRILALGRSAPGGGRLDPRHRLGRSDRCGRRGRAFPADVDGRGRTRAGVGRQGGADRLRRRLPAAARRVHPRRRADSRARLPARTSRGGDGALPVGPAGRRHAAADGGRVRVGRPVPGRALRGRGRARIAGVVARRSQRVLVAHALPQPAGALLPRRLPRPRTRPVHRLRQ